MGYLGEPMPVRELQFEIVGETAVNFDNRLAAGADQMMVMVIRPVGHQLPAGGAVADVHPVYQAHFQERMNIPVHGREIAFVRQQGVDFAIRQR